MLVTDGAPIHIDGVPAAFACFDCGEDGLAIWDAQRRLHVSIPHAYTAEQLRAALNNLGQAPTGLPHV